MPAIAMLSLGKIGAINRALSKSPKTKTMFDMTMVIGSISMGLPLAIGVFPPVSQNKGYNCEEKFKNHENIYFSKGLWINFESWAIHIKIKNDREEFIINTQFLLNKCFLFAF